MSDELKKDTQGEQPTIESTTEESTTAETEALTVEETKTQDSDVDFHKAELEKELARKAFKEREAKRRSDAPDSSESSAKGTSISDAAEIARLAAQEVLAVVQKDKRDQLLSDMSESDSERELIEYHLENTIKSSGDIKRDIENAKKFANINRIAAVKKEEEFARANKAPVAGASASALGTVKADDYSDIPQVDVASLQAIAAASGKSFDELAKSWRANKK